MTDTKEQELIEACDEANYKHGETYHELNDARRKLKEARGKWDETHRKWDETHRKLQEYRNNKAQ